MEMVSIGERLPIGTNTALMVRELHWDELEGCQRRIGSARVPPNRAPLGGGTVWKWSFKSRKFTLFSHPWREWASLLARRDRAGADRSITVNLHSHFVTFANLHCAPYGSNLSFFPFFASGSASKTRMGGSISTKSQAKVSQINCQIMKIFPSLTELNIPIT